MNVQRLVSNADDTYYESSKFIYARIYTLKNQNFVLIYVCENSCKIDFKIKIVNFLIEGGLIYLIQMQNFFKFET